MMSDARKIAQVSLLSARACLVKRNYGRAFANFLLFLKLAPQRSEEVRHEFSVAMREWSESLERDGKIADLFKCYDQACEIFPNHDTVLNNIGAQLFRLGYAEEAAAYIRRALIINPDYLAARENLENICSHLVERWHFRMLNDHRRNKAYKDAIRRAVHKGYTSVLDIGAGTGILSLIACDVGASTVYACERSHAMYEVARDVLETNCADDRVLLFHRSSTDLRVPDDIAQKVSLVVTETFDAGLFGEHIVSTLTHAWRNLLCNSQSMRGSVVPCAATMYVCGIESEAIRKQNRLLYPVLQNLDLSGVDIVCTTGQVAEEPYTTENLAWLRGGYKMLTNVAELLRVNFCNPQELEALQLGKDWTANLIVKQHGHLDALAVWFDLHLDECVTITTGPDMENCWEQAVYPVLTVQREKDTGQELCYLNKRENLQVTFHFEQDCLRLSTCTASPDIHIPSPNQSFKQSSKECNVNRNDQHRDPATNSQRSKALPFRKRKIKNQFEMNETKESTEDIVNNSATDHSDDSCIIDDIVLPRNSFHSGASAMPTDELLLQQCGNLTIHSGSRSIADSQLNNNSSNSVADIQTDAVSQLDNFIVPTSTNRLDFKSEFSNLVTQPSSINRPILAGRDPGVQNTSSHNTVNQGSKILVEYLDDSDDEPDSFQAFLNACKSDGSARTSTVNFTSASPSRSLEQNCENSVQNGDTGIIVNATSNRYRQFDVNDISMSTGEYQVAPEMESDTDRNHVEEKLYITVPIDNIELLNDNLYHDETISKGNSAIFDNEDCDTADNHNSEKPICQHARSNDIYSMKRQQNKLVCLAEHSDVIHLNDIHLNRACFRALECFSRKQGKTLSLMHNTTRLCFLALQAKALTYDPITMVTSEEHHGTIETVMAANNLRPDDIGLLDLMEGEENHGKYDVLMFDIVEPCGALRQQIFEDIAVLRVTSLSESGIIIPGRVTISGLFIESAELERTSHVIGSHLTLGYSIADFINVFQLRNHVDIDLETLPHEKMTEVFQMFQMDLNHHDDCGSLESLRQSNQISLKVLESGNIHALVYWFELELIEGVKVSTLDPRCHWRQAGIMMKDEVTVLSGQNLVATVTIQNSCLDVAVRMCESV